MTFAEPSYAAWASRLEPSEGELEGMGRQAAGFDHRPSVSIALVVSDEDEVWIRSSVISVLGQAYPHLDLLICDNGSRRPHVREVMEDYAAGDGRVTLTSLTERAGRAHAYNEALSGARGEFVAVLDAGDILAPEALFEAVELLQHVPADVIYSDEDRLDVAGVRSDPVFKPLWSPEMLLSTDYVGRLCLIRGSVFGESGGFRPGFEGAEEHDLMLRLSEKDLSFVHLPRILYHRRELLGRGAAEHEQEPTGRAIRDAVARRGENAVVEPDTAGGSFRLVRGVRGKPTVGVVVSVPGWMDRAPFVAEIEENAGYPIHSLVVAGIREDARQGLDDVHHPFPARAANLAAEAADGSFLAFVDARSRDFSRGWLRTMLGEAQRPGVGAVGCRLLDNAGRVRHGGSVAELGTLTGFREEPVAAGGRYLPATEHAFDAGYAPAEFMLVRRSVFEAAGGFDDENLPTSFYDLDLCFRLRESRRRNVYTPHASATFGAAMSLAPDEEEIAYVWRRWWEGLIRLLFYRQPPLSRQGFDGDALRSLAAAPGTR